jgi:demethylmenaquinone methyltransferase / 2-methoxy-6-polyprenyl-1,4-benzoquinol methylase
MYVAPLRPLRRRVVTLSGIAKGSKVIDVACGTGEQSIAFTRAGCSVVGIDISSEMLAKAQKKVDDGMDIEFICQDASLLPYEDATFDVATISLGLHDMPKDMALKVLGEMKRITKPDGKIVIVEHHTSPTLFGKLMHWIMMRFDTRYYPAFIEAGLKSYLDATGLKVETRFTALLGILQVAVCHR